MISAQLYARRMVTQAMAKMFSSEGGNWTVTGIEEQASQTVVKVEGFHPLSDIHGDKVSEIVITVMPVRIMNYNEYRDA